MRRTESNPRLLDCKQAAQMLSVSTFTIRRLVWSGTLPHVMVGRLVRLDLHDLEAWIESSKAKFGVNAV